MDALTLAYWWVIRLKPAELPQSVYLSLAKLGPSYEALDLGVGGSLISKAVREVTGCTTAVLRSHYRRTGDMGDAVQSLKLTQPSLSFSTMTNLSRTKAGLTVNSIFRSLHSLSEQSGQGSNAAKLNLIKGLLTSAKGGLEAKFIVRICERNMRIHSNEKTIVAAVGRAAILFSLMQNYESPDQDESQMIDQSPTKKGKAGKADSRFGLPNMKVTLSLSLSLCHGRTKTHVFGAEIVGSSSSVGCLATEEQCAASSGARVVRHA